MSSTVSSTSTFVAASYTTGTEFMGWYLYETPSPVNCGSGGRYHTSYMTTGSTGYNYAACSYSTMPNFATTCSSNTLLYQDGGIGSCESPYSCEAITIYPTDHAGDKDATWLYECVVNWDAFSICRTLPAEWASQTVAPSTSNQNMDASHSVTTTTSAKSTTSNSSPTSSSSSDSSDSSGLSGGAIGGIVVGCVAGVAIIAALLFRKKIMACFGRGQDNNFTPVAPTEMPTDQTVAHEMESSRPPGPFHEIDSSTGSVKQERIVHEIG